MGKGRPTLAGVLVLSLALGAAAGPALPPLPAGVASLAFSDFFAPIGRRGLEYSEQLLSLDGRRVRILGFMVQQEAALPGRFLFAPRPLALHESEYGLADDLPAATLLVEAPADAGRMLPFTPGPLLLTGTLRLGNREEPDGRVSTVRLVLDPPSISGSQR